MPPAFGLSEKRQRLASGGPRREEGSASLGAKYSPVRSACGGVVGDSELNNHHGVSCYKIADALNECGGSASRSGAATTIEPMEPLRAEQEHKVGQCFGLIVANGFDRVERGSFASG